MTGRVIADIGVEVDSTDVPNRIARQESACAWIIITMSQELQPCLRVRKDQLVVSLNGLVMLDGRPPLS